MDPMGLVITVQQPDGILRLHQQFFGLPSNHPIIPPDETLRPEAATDTDAAGQQQESRNSCSRSRLRETLDKNIRFFLRPRKITTENHGLD